MTANGKKIIVTEIVREHFVIIIIFSSGVIKSLVSRKTFPYSYYVRSGLCNAFFFNLSRHVH